MRGSPDNPLSVYVVICTKHITPANFQQERDKCKTWLEGYRKQSAARVQRPLDVWLRHYGPALRGMFNDPAGQGKASADYGALKKIHQDSRHQLAAQPDATIATVYESQEL